MIPKRQSPFSANHVLLSFELCFQTMQLISGEYCSNTLATVMMTITVMSDMSAKLLLLLQLPSP